MFHAERLSAELGLDLWLKREDLLHTGAHKLNNTLGQCLLAKYMGKTRVLAETGAGQHGVATATACALLGLECIVYMGAVDAARQRPNLLRMELLGACVAVVEHGQRTLKDAINEAMRAWVSEPETTLYVLGSALGPHPFPSIVADFQQVIGREAHTQMLERCGSLPDVAAACVGGGSNAIGLFRGFIDDDAVELVGVEAGGDGPGSGKHAARFSGGKPGVLHGCFTWLLQDEDGQIEETHSVSAGLDYPAVGPEHAALEARGRARYEWADDRDGPRGLRAPRRARGDPRRSREQPCGRVGRARTRGPRRQASTRQPVRSRGQGPRHDRAAARGAPRVSTNRLEARMAALRERGQRGVAPYVTAGDGGYATTLAVLRALDAAGATCVELGLPFSDPIADGPVLQAAADRALKAGASFDGTLAMLRELREGSNGAPPSELPVLLFSYANPLVHRGLPEACRALADAGGDGLLVPDVPVEEGEPLREAARDAGLCSVFFVAPTTSTARVRAVAQKSSGFVYVIGRLGVTGAQTELGDEAVGFLERVRSETELPLALGFGIRNAEQVRVVTRVAELAIVGSAMVDRIHQAAATPEGAARAATEYFRELASGLPAPTRAS